MEEIVKELDQVEEVDETTGQGKQEAIKDGVVIYQTEEGRLGYQYIGEPTLKDVTYYLRLLEELTDDLWKAELYQPKEEKQVDADA